MTPEEHLAEAERLTEAARADYRDAGEGLGRTLAESRAHIALAAAQVHATLFLGGAMLLAGAAGYDTARDRLADAVLGTQR
jgi:hypothetical protein